MGHPSIDAVPDVINVCVCVRENVCCAQYYVDMLAVHAVYDWTRGRRSNKYAMGTGV